MMKACKVCGLTKSSLHLRVVWDKEIQAYMDHYVCNDCWIKYKELETLVQKSGRAYKGGKRVS